jgi:hypothetical protein
MKPTHFTVIGLLSCCSPVVLGQTPLRKLPQVINRPNINVTSPFISLDGNTLLFTSDYVEDEPTIYYSQKDRTAWSEPKALPKHINNRLNFKGGYSLSADGKTIYITSIKSGGVGGYDIWHGNLKGTSWGDLENLFIPINSKEHEGCPTFTPDGATMYFMRCQKMTQQKAEGCKIMVTHKGANLRWEEPAELPANINTGNSQTPRISSDGKILIFASNTIQPNKGGMDLYVSRLENSTWSNPVPLAFVNTEKDDQFVSFIANGRYLLKDAPGKFSSEIVEYLMPEEWRPKAIMKIEGVVLNAKQAPASAYISVTDLSTQTRMFSGRPDKTGNYFLYLSEGSRYELSIDPEESHYTYYSKTIDMTRPDNPLVQKHDVVLRPIMQGDELELEGIQFKPHSVELKDAAFELRRLSRLIRATPQYMYELQVQLIGYEEDSVPASPDLTEISIDSVIVQLGEVDSVGLQHARDSVVVSRVYHNNRTEKQALKIIEQLVALGIDRNRLTYFVNARPEALPENRGIKVRLVTRSKDSR